jgi:hypothetical protein
MRDQKGTITGHYVAHWGVPKAIRPRRARGIREFAILEFSPRGARGTWRYATNGMSSYLQAHPDPGTRVRTELYCVTRNRALWVGDLLASMATYPVDYGTYLSEWDTIDAGGPIDRGLSLYTGVLLVRPGSADQPTLGLIGTQPDKILVHQVIGLLPADLDRASAAGGRTLWDRLLEVGRDVALDAEPNLP